jgi:hypothetical protein
VEVHALASLQVLSPLLLLLLLLLPCWLPLNWALTQHRSHCGRAVSTIHPAATPTCLLLPLAHVLTW